MDRELEREIDRIIEGLGYELVEMERAGTARRPILRLRIDRPDPASTGVTVEDCRIVSRALEEFLDTGGRIAPGYVLEVSSPGVERPLVRPRDFERFAGREVLLAGKNPLAGRARKLEGVLLGLDADGKSIGLRLADGEELSVPRAEVTSANLVFRWGGGPRPK